MQQKIIIYGDEMEKRKIFISAYACEPDKGSEIGVGWHWVLEMSKYYELWVLTRKSNQTNIEDYLLKSGTTYDIHFIYFDLPDYLRFWKKRMRGVRTYYVIWQLLTNSIVQKVMVENDIEIYHLLTYGNALWPASRYGIRKTFIWGPTGGLDTIERQYYKRYSLRNRLVEVVRRLIVYSTRFNIGFINRVKRSDLIICKANSTIAALPKKYRNKGVVFTDVATDEEIEYPKRSFQINVYNI